MSMSSWRAAQEVGFFGYPDEDEACVQHGNLIDSCSECRAAFEQEEAEYRAWRAEQPAPLTEAPKDLPW